MFALSSSQRLALLHTATVLASLYSEDFASPNKLRLFGLLALVCLGFLLIIFQVLPRETAMRTIRKHTGLAPPPPSKAEEGFDLSITDVRRRHGKSEYRVDGVYETHQWSTWLRYSDLYAMAKRLGKLNIFPPKSSVLATLIKSDQTFDFVDARRNKLDAFIHQVFPNRQAFDILVSTTLPELRQVLALPDALQISAQAGKADRQAILQQALNTIKQVEEIASHSKSRAGGDGWIFHSARDGIDCFLKKEGNFTYSLGRGPITVTPRRMAEFMMDLNHRLSWDDMFKFQRVVEDFKAYSFDEPEQGNAEWDVLSLQISHGAFTSPTSLVAERDTLCASVVGRRKRDGALCLALSSVEDARVPEGKDGFIRARVQCAGFLFEPAEEAGGKTVMTTMGMVDPNGNIPSFVVNAVAPKRAFLIKDINAACIKHTSA